jgi:hypothetical protein
MTKGHVPSTKKFSFLLVTKGICYWRTDGLHNFAIFLVPAPLANYALESTKHGGVFLRKCVMSHHYPRNTYEKLLLEYIHY